MSEVYRLIDELNAGSFSIGFFGAGLDMRIGYHGMEAGFGVGVIF